MDTAQLSTNQVAENLVPSAMQSEINTIQPQKQGESDQDLKGSNTEGNMDAELHLPQSLRKPKISTDDMGNGNYAAGNIAESSGDTPIQVQMSSFNPTATKLGPSRQTNRPGRITKPSNGSADRQKHLGSQFQTQPDAIVTATVTVTAGRPPIHTEVGTAPPNPKLGTIPIRMPSAADKVYIPPPLEPARPGPKTKPLNGNLGKGGQKSKPIAPSETNFPPSVVSPTHVVNFSANITTSKQVAEVPKPSDSKAGYLPLIAGIGVAVVVSALLFVTATRIFKKTTGNPNKEDGPESSNGGTQPSSSTSFFTNPIAFFTSKWGSKKKVSPKEALTNAMNAPQRQKYDVKSIFYEHDQSGYVPAKDIRFNGPIENDKFDSIYSEAPQPVATTFDNANFDDEYPENDEVDSIYGDDEEDAFDSLVKERRLTEITSTFNDGIASYPDPVAIESPQSFATQELAITTPVQARTASGLSIPLQLKDISKNGPAAIFKHDSTLDDEFQNDLHEQQILEEIEKRESTMSEMTVDLFQERLTKYSRDTCMSYDLDFIEEHIAKKETLNSKAAEFPDDASFGASPEGESPNEFDFSNSQDEGRRATNMTSITYDADF